MRKVEPGELSIRRHERRGRYRVALVTYLKVAPGRWEAYARWLWRQLKGEIPEGMCVLHLDGNPLNDDIDNLTLGKLSDAHYLWDTERLQSTQRGRNARKQAAGVRLWRKRRLAVDAAAGLVRPWRGYARFECGALVGPFNKPSDARRWLGVPNGITGYAAALGFPGRDTVTAAALRLMAMGVPVERDALQTVLARVGWNRLVVERVAQAAARAVDGVEIFPGRFVPVVCDYGREFGDRGVVCLPDSPMALELLAGLDKL